MRFFSLTATLVSALLVFSQAPLARAAPVPVAAVIDPASGAVVERSCIVNDALACVKTWKRTGDAETESATH
ncbi:hypothetical protein FRB99_001466 [Tulasnella sp. 403]|nr:hypothetical protein FRB99_001466 [Tulasnella sp. 403]